MLGRAHRNHHEPRVAVFCATTIALIALCAPLATAAEPEVLGAGVDVTEVTRIADILADPDAYLGKTVRVEGGILDVCPRKGCWMELGEEGESIRIKVEDDVIVFPAAALGRVAAAQGEVEAIEMTREKYLDWLAHLAEERGEEFNPESADIGDGPYRIIRIQGTGAKIG
jgi:hypothetical protein